MLPQYHTNMIIIRGYGNTGLLLLYSGKGWHVKLIIVVLY